MSDIRHGRKIHATAGCRPHGAPPPHCAAALCPPSFHLVHVGDEKREQRPRTSVWIGNGPAPWTSGRGRQLAWLPPPRRDQAGACANRSSASSSITVVIANWNNAAP